jgi:hypothetical protein
MARGKEAFMGKGATVRRYTASAGGHICTVPSSVRGQMTPHRKAATIAAVSMT